MITGHDFYAIMTAMVPLYVAMFLAYGSVRWWKIFTPDQCSGINRFVAIFAVPLLSFHFISMNNPYKMNFRFIAADTLQKLVMLVVLGVSTRFINLLTFEWTITIFSLSTLPNSLVIGIPLLSGMYGESSATLMVQIVVMQSIVWYTLLLFLFEFRGAKVLIMERFPQSGGEIAEIEVDPDVVSLDAQDVIETTSERRRDGKLLVTVRKSSASRRSFGVGSLSNAEIYSVSSSAVQTPRASFFNQSDINSFAGFPGGRLSNFGPADDVYTIHSSSWGPGYGHGQGHVTSPRNSNFEVDLVTTPKPWLQQNISQHRPSHDIHVFDRSSSAPANPKAGRPRSDFSLPITHLTRVASELSQKGKPDVDSTPDHGPTTVLVSNEGAGSQMPSASVMGRLILLMVWRKLIRNPNTYGSIIGLIWALVSYRWDVTMPKIVEDSISLISKTGLGMAMFSLGLFMALQPKLIACGKSKAIIGMVAKFLIGPGVTAVSALIVGLHGTLLRVTIVQATLSAGIVPFVFAKEYDVHPTILSTAVIFGMLITVPITLCYYILLEL